MVPMDTIFGRSAWLGTLIADAVLTPQVYPPSGGKSHQASQNSVNVMYCIQAPGLDDLSHKSPPQISNAQLPIWIVSQILFCGD